MAGSAARVRVWRLVAHTTVVPSTLTPLVDREGRLWVVRTCLIECVCYAGTHEQWVEICAECSGARVDGAPSCENCPYGLPWAHASFHDCARSRTRTRYVTIATLTASSTSFEMLGCRSSDRTSSGTSAPSAETTSHSPQALPCQSSSASAAVVRPSS